MCPLFYSDPQDTTVSLSYNGLSQLGAFSLIPCAEDPSHSQPLIFCSAVLFTLPTMPGQLTYLMPILPFTRVTAAASAAPLF